MTKIKMLRLYRPHAGQRALHESYARFRVAACGRRWGKTVAATAEMIKHAWQKPGSLSFWVAPVLRQSTIAFDLVKRAMPRGALAAIHKVDRRVSLVNGSVIEFKSAEIPENLRGFGIDFLVVDEAAFLAGELWEEVLRPALSDRQGRALFIGTPKGRNWFFHLFARGMDNGQANWESFTFPTGNNPYIRPEEIEDARRSLPEAVFAQEYLARFIDEGAGVFLGVNDIIRGKLADPLPDERYTAGLDIGRHRDYTVLTIINPSGSVVYFDRFFRTTWTVMKQRVTSAVKRYNRAVVWVDSTGVGDPILEDLIRMGAACRGYRFTNESKAALVENLILLIDEKKIVIPPIQELVDELMIFETRNLPGGRVSYGAPAGFHDDCVISLALAAWGIRGTRVNQSDFVRTLGF
ncbi:MAG: terminase family protein [Deltaproteobacteria bacterium]|nr:terminase family protein [Candidatus Zymogenaceae bacterium]